MKRTRWNMVALGEHCDVFSGFPFKSRGFTDDPDDVALVKGENIGQGEILWNISKRWPRADFPALKRFELIPGDVVLAMDRPWVPAGLKFARIPKFAPKSILVQRCARLRASGGLEQSFLPYLIGSSGFVAYVQNVGRGVGVPHISGSQIEDFTFALPPLEEQRRIAGVLTAYDELIENNQRRMALLEEAARKLYAEWFVRLRYPGRARNCSKGILPKAWTKRPLRDLATVNRATLTNSYKGELDYVDISTVTWGHIGETTRYDFADAPSRARRIVQHGDIIWSCVRPNLRSHAVIWNPKPNLIVSTGFAVLTPKALPTSYLYQATTTDAFVRNLENRARGAAYPAVVASDFEESEIFVPPAPLLTRFNDFAEPLLGQIHNLTFQSQKLRTARDLLLPRLMSGEIAV